MKLTKINLLNFRNCANINIVLGENMNIFIGNNAQGKTNLLELAEFFRRCDLVISLDSGSTHLAWACEKPKIISIFCSTPKGFYAPVGAEDKYIALSGNLSCQPCHKKHCKLALSEQGCTYLPKVKDVLDSVYKLLPLKEEV